MHHLDTLIHPIRRQHRRLRVRITLELLRDGLRVGHDDVPPLPGGVVPARLEDVLSGEQAAEDDGEDDEEDAGAGVAAGSRGRPGVGEEGCCLAVEEGHGHADAHA